MSDAVDHPEHYNALGAKCIACGEPIECIDIVENLGFNIGNAIKCLWRLEHKGAALADLRKAVWYLNREISLRSRKEPEPAKQPAGVLDDPILRLVYPASYVRCAPEVPVFKRGEALREFREWFGSLRNVPVADAVVAWNASGNASGPTRRVIHESRVQNTAESRRCVGKPYKAYATGTFRRGIVYAADNDMTVHAIEALLSRFDEWLKHWLVGAVQRVDECVKEWNRVHGQSERLEYEEAESLAP